MYFPDPRTPKTKRKVEDPIVEWFYEPYTLDSLNGDVSIALHPNDTVQLRDNSLLTIDHFEHEIQGDIDELNINVFVVGMKYLRFRDCEDLGGFLRYDSREVYGLGFDKRIIYRPDRPRHPVHQIRRRVNLIKTNLSHRDFQSPSRETFVCRYLRQDQEIVLLSAEQTDNNRVQVDDRRRRNMFVSRRSKAPQPNGTKRYTFGDGFCGVGGTSAGARKAGLDINWAFDGNLNTCEAYEQNFHNTDVFAGSVDQFLALRGNIHVDVLHLSPPCQPFSIAHTIAGVNDESNSATLFCIGELLSRVRPRICTIEEVPQLIRGEEHKYLSAGLSTDRRLYFQAMLRQILEAEYSVKWKVLRAQEYGVPQCRDRVIFLLSW